MIEELKDNELKKDELNIENLYVKLQITLNKDSGEDINKEEISQLADYLFRLNNLFELKRKYRNLFKIIPDKIIFSNEIIDWFEWEKVLLLLFSNYPFQTTREFIWKYEIKKVNLRNIIKDKPEYIETSDDNLLLTDKGLTYLIEKLESYI